MLGNASCFFVGQTGINIYVKRAWLINAHMACGEPLCLRSLADHGTFLSCCFCPQTFADSIHPGSMTWFLPVSSAPVSALPVSGTRKPFNLQLSCRSSKEKSLFKFPTRFLSGLFVFFLLSCIKFQRKERGYMNHSATSPLWTPDCTENPWLSFNRQFFEDLTVICVCVCQVSSVVSDSTTLWTVARQVPLSMGLSRQGYWNGLPCSPPGDLPNPEIASLTSQALVGRSFTTTAT